MELLQHLADKGIAYTYRGDALEVHGSLDLSARRGLRLPQQLEVFGDFSLMDAVIYALPERLLVRGSLDVSNTPIRTLPPNTRVGGSLMLRGCLLDALPEVIEVHGDLDGSEERTRGLLNALSARGVRR